MKSLQIILTSHRVSNKIFSDVLAMYMGVLFLFYSISCVQLPSLFFLFFFFSLLGQLVWPSFLTPRLPCLRSGGRGLTDRGRSQRR